MAQSSITHYFNKRKRPIVDDLKNRSKVLILERQNSGDFSNSLLSSSRVVSSISSKAQTAETLNQKIEFSVAKELNGDDKNTIQSEKRKSNVLNDKRIFETPKTTMAIKLKNKSTLTKKSLKVKSSTNQGVDWKQPDIRQLFKIKNVNEQSNISQPTVVNLIEGNVEMIESSTDKSEVVEPEEEQPFQRNIVPFVLKGTLSPYKTKPSTSCVENVLNEPSVSASPVDPEAPMATNSETDVARKELGLMTPKRLMEARGEGLSINEIKSKLSRSARLAELRNSIKKFNQGAEQLKQLEEKKEKLVAVSPCLKKFQSIELEVPVSPQKDAVASPKKSLYSSPGKSPFKSAAYQRLASLAQPGVPTLNLPYTYRFLAEVFRCVDAISSMLYNRKETITFRKLKPAVQEMLRRNFTEHHLGQIKRMHPTAYTFRREKICSFGTTSKSDKYDLIIEPVLNSKTEGGDADSSKAIEPPLMTPSCLLERRQAFHQCLLEKIKNCHEEFLLTLDPPLIIPRSKLTRWHPGFELEQVADIEPDSIPQPPNVEKYSTAKDVLDRAKNLFNCNQRMEMALLKASEHINKLSPSTPMKQSGVNSEPSTSPLLKGLPRSLIDKIRAKQAAKAMLAMTRTPVQDLEATQYMRLPELARILRNLYVAEKKGVLPLEMVLEKVAHSYRENLSRAELEAHVRLLMKVVPGWLELFHIRKTDFLKLSKHADVSAVFKKLEAVATEKSDRSHR